MVAELKGKLTLDGKPFVREVTNAGDAVETKLGKKLNDLKRTIGAAFTVTAIANFTKEIMRTADAADNYANRLGISVESTQSLQVMAQNAGLAMGDFETAILKTFAASQDAQTGNEKLAGAFNTLGISMADLKRLNTEQLFERVANAISKNSGNADVLAASFDVIGLRAGPKLLDQLEKIGTQGFDSINDKMIETNQIMSTQTIKQWDELEQKLADATRTAQTFVAEYGSKLIDFIQDTAAAWGAWSAGGSLSIQDARAARLAVIEDTEDVKVATDNVTTSQDNLGDAAEKASDKVKKATDQAKNQAEAFKTIRDTIKGMTEREIDMLINAIAKIGTAINNLPSIPADKLDWLEDLNKLEFKSLTTGQADQMVKAIKALFAGITSPEINWPTAYDMLAYLEELGNLEFHGLTSSQANQMVGAIKVLFNGLSELSGRVPADMFDFLEDLGNLKFQGLTSGQASQMVRAIRELVTGISGIDATKAKQVMEIFEAISGATPGKYEVAVTLPDQFKDGFPLIFPDGMEGTLNDINGSLKTLAGLKGVVWA